MEPVSDDDIKHCLESGDVTVTIESTLSIPNIKNNNDKRNC